MRQFRRVRGELKRRQEGVIGTHFGDTVIYPKPLPITGPVFATKAQIASLSTTSEAALRAKALADDVKSGVVSATTSAIANIKDVDNRVAPYALTTAIWFARTGDATYLTPLRNFILESPRPPDTVQALAEMRAYGGLFAAVDILKNYDAWGKAQDESACPNYPGKTWLQFLDKLPTRALETDNARWYSIQDTARNSANNWGSVARYAYFMWGVLADNDDAQTDAMNLTKRFLGDQSLGLDVFRSSAEYEPSWDNWTTGNLKATQQPMLAGIGKTDPLNPGLDGCVINDIDRGGGTYRPLEPFYGALADPADTSGLTYSLENSIYVQALFACLMNIGYKPRTWGEGGNAFDRMNRYLCEVSPGGTQSLLDHSEAKTAIYRNDRWVINRLSNFNYGTPIACLAGATGTPRMMPYADWLAASSSLWGVQE